MVPAVSPLWPLASARQARWWSGVKTGAAKVLKVIALACDFGLVINPLACLGKVRAHPMALGMALQENFVMQDGRC